MLNARYKNKRLILDAPLEFPEGTKLVLQVRPGSISELGGTDNITRVNALYKGKALRPKKPLKVQEGSIVNILSLTLVRSLESFQGMLGDLKEDSVTLQHKARKW